MIKYNENENDNEKQIIIDNVNRPRRRHENKFIKHKMRIGKVVYIYIKGALMQIWKSPYLF